MANITPKFRALAECVNNVLTYTCRRFELNLMYHQIKNLRIFAKIMIQQALFFKVNII